MQLFNIAQTIMSEILNYNTFLQNFTLSSLEQDITCCNFISGIFLITYDKHLNQIYVSKRLCVLVC